MKAVILAGGVGSRLSEETVVKPKPMVEIGGRPILWHIMKIYAAHGINDFIDLLRLQRLRDQGILRELLSPSVRLPLRLEKQPHGSASKNGVEPWTVTLVDTGENTMTGGRLKRVREFVKDGTFCFTYGDGVSDVDVRD